MKVLAIMGSPRRRGNTAGVLANVCDVLTERGAKVEVLPLGGLRLTGCIECFTCQKRRDRVNCPVKDDMKSIYPKILRSDALVFATPIFCWGPSAQLKAVWDRFYGLCKFGESSYDSLIEGKASALVTTAGGDASDGTNLTAQSYRKLADFMRMRRCGELKLTGVGSPDDTRADKALRARARRFGGRLWQRLNER